MLNCKQLYQVFKENDFEYFAGVPDSTFKDWMKFLDDMHGKGLTNRIVAIERDAIAWVSGYHVATGKIGVVYMQNSGLGNTVNPITSLSDPEVYNIPMLLMVGWRGEPGKKDEPQHIKMGKITLELLEVMKIKYSILPDNMVEVSRLIIQAKEYMKDTGRAYALVIKKGCFETYEQDKNLEQDYELTREDAIKTVLDYLGREEIIVSTTGKISRELFEYREAKQQGHQNDFLMVGSMGCAASFAAEIALQKPNKKVFIFDGDGAVIMGAGVLSTIGYYAPKNLYHIVFNNESYESTGGQPTTSPIVNFEQLALANSYKTANSVNTRNDLVNIVQELNKQSGPQMLVVKVKKGSRKNLGRPTTTPEQNKQDLMRFLEK